MLPHFLKRMIGVPLLLLGIGVAIPTVASIRYLLRLEVVSGRVAAEVGAGTYRIEFAYAGGQFDLESSAALCRSAWANKSAVQVLVNPYHPHDCQLKSGAWRHSIRMGSLAGALLCLAAWLLLSRAPPTPVGTALGVGTALDVAALVPRVRQVRSDFLAELHSYPRPPSRLRDWLAMARQAVGGLAFFHQKTPDGTPSHQERMIVSSCGAEPRREP
jgi:hypothetical protein